MPLLHHHREIEGNAEKWAALRSYLFNYLSIYLLLLFIIIVLIVLISV